MLFRTRFRISLFHPQPECLQEGVVMTLFIRRIIPQMPNLSDLESICFFAQIEFGLKIVRIW
jgi:hypothetical protein